MVAVTLIAGLLWFFLNRGSAPQTLATLNLTISQSTRGEGGPAPKVNLSHNQDALKIVLRLPGQVPRAERYRVEMDSDNGQSRSLKTVAQDGQSLTVVIPASELNRGQYSLKLFTVGSDGAEQRINGNYFFTVE
jgi:methionine-rich copper-binding protein CopC